MFTPVIQYSVLMAEEKPPFNIDIFEYYIIMYIYTHICCDFGVWDKAVCHDLEQSFHTAVYLGVRVEEKNALVIHCVVSWFVLPPLYLSLALQAFPFLYHELLHLPSLHCQVQGGLSERLQGTSAKGPWPQHPLDSRKLVLECILQLDYTFVMLSQLAVKQQATGVQTNGKG